MREGEDKMREEEGKKREAQTSSGSESPEIHRDFQLKKGHWLDVIQQNLPAMANQFEPNTTPLDTKRRSHAMAQHPVKHPQQIQEKTQWPP